MQFVSSTTGWAVGTDRIVATTDGVHWSAQLRTTAPGFNAVDFIDTNHGWAVDPQQIVRTVDGGHHWQPISDPCPHIVSVHFFSATSGFAVASDGDLSHGGELVTTSDGGESWTPQAAPSGVQSVCVDRSGHGWLGSMGDIYGTTDIGQHWTPSLSTSADGAGIGPYDIVLQCAGNGSAWAEMLGGAAMSQQAHIGLHTIGTTWTPIFAEPYFPHPGIEVAASSPGSYFGAFSAVSPSDAAFVDNCPACGYGTAQMEVATDGGANLTRRGDVGDMTLAIGASFVSIDNGWVVGDDWRAKGTRTTTDARIEHTSDGGHSWTTQYSVPER